MDKLMITLDGPNGVGKSSTAKLVMQELRLTCLGTGVMYWAVACKSTRRGLDHTDETGIGKLIRTVDLRMITDPDTSRMCVNSRDVTGEIRKPEVSAVTSVVAVVPEARRVLTECTHRIIAEHDRHIVIEGRDTTTVVALDAEMQVLLTADATAYIGRRAAELGGRADQVTVTDSIPRRGRDNSTISDLTEAANGVDVVDSTRLGLDEAVAEILKLVPGA